MKLYLLIILIRKNSERLLKNFKTIKNIINASPQELPSKAKIPYKTSIEKNINGKKKFIFSLLENEIEFIENKDI
jgi:ERCC4-type nuclease